MPKKTCPECSKEHGTRKKVCECGHSFSASKHPLYPEPGGWVLADTKGMPKILPPDPLPKGTIETQQLRDEYVSYEGLGFCIWSYIPANRIADTKLRALWRKARRAMQDVVEHLEGIE